MDESVEMEIQDNIPRGGITPRYIYSVILSNLLVAEEYGGYAYGDFVARNIPDMLTNSFKMMPTHVAVWFRSEANLNAFISDKRSSVKVDCNGNGVFLVDIFHEVLEIVFVTFVNLTTPKAALDVWEMIYVPTKAVRMAISDVSVLHVLTENISNKVCHITTENIEFLQSGNSGLVKRLIIDMIESGWSLKNSEGLNLCFFVDGPRVLKTLTRHIPLTVHLSRDYGSDHSYVAYLPQTVDQ